MIEEESVDELPDDEQAVDFIKKARRAALDFLSRREHSRFELAQKLGQKGFDSTTIDFVLSRLQAENLLSEQRFVESFVHSRINKGYGPLYIRQALRQRGIASELVTELLENIENWAVLACQVRQKRFGEALPKNLPERAKQSRFLRYRGFTALHINSALKKKESGIGH